MVLKPDIEKMEAEKNSKRLFQTLKHDEDPDIRHKAMEALGRIGWQPKNSEEKALIDRVRSGKSVAEPAKNVTVAEHNLAAQQTHDAQNRRQNIKANLDNFIAQFKGSAREFCQVAADIRQHWQEDRDGSWSVSQRLYRVAIEKWPESWYGYFGLGENLYGQTKRPTVEYSPAQTATFIAQAIENLEKACALAESPEPFIKLAAILVSTDRQTEARDLFQRGDALGVHEDKLLYPPKWLSNFYWDFATGASTSQVNLKQYAVPAFVRSMQLNADNVTLYQPGDPEAHSLWRMAKMALAMSEKSAPEPAIKPPSVPQKAAPMVTAMPSAMRNSMSSQGELPSVDHGIAEMVKILNGYCQDQSIPSDDRKKKAQEIGEILYNKGGKYLMVEVNNLVRKQQSRPGAARLIESWWDGIGDWQG